MRAALSKDEGWKALERRELEIWAQQEKYDREVAKFKEEFKTEVNPVYAQRRQDDFKAKLNAVTVEKETYMVSFAQKATAAAPK